MSRLSPPPMNLHRSQSPVSIAASDTTYHSFHDVELFEPASPVTTVNAPRTRPKKDNHVEPQLITRHDSGYESAYSGSRSGTSQSSHGHNSMMSSRSTPQTRLQKRPALQRATKSKPISYPGRHSGHSLHVTKSQQQHQQPNSYYHFPSLETISGLPGHDETTEEDQAYHPPPPQTTHYWMSDHTRRLEYAAIDAASRGLKGWIMKHVVPDCFVPKNNRRLTFDDDTGSVRRYRLELDCDDSSVKGSKGSKKLRWLFGR
ncbi:hypothetical protein HD806DRAFT_211587 [Xylariaceae sp. AK1471]|nr:hypothetical protein HD806DRAFT_211587 [Xylariaceae sp. AK1471]